MSTPRLTFLYPTLFRFIKSCQPTTYPSIRAPPTKGRNRNAGLHTSRRCAQQTYQQRYGSATEPGLPPPPKPKDGFGLVNDELRKEQPRIEASKTQPEEKEKVKQSDKLKGAVLSDEAEPIALNPKPASHGPQPPKNEAKNNPVDGMASEPLRNKALDMVLKVSSSQSPSELKDESHKNHPHLAPSLYEHHFDTYSLVRELSKSGGFTTEQSVTLMKAIRSMLAVNLEIAKEGLVSKSDVENETYLFRAACSELKTTLQTTRHSEIQRQRSQRAQLQHETDILSQKMTQDLMSVKEDMKAMFHNRKMAVQEEKQKLDGRISDLNYEITVLLNSDCKSEVESLRWVLTRRVALAIVATARKFQGGRHRARR